MADWYIGWVGARGSVHHRKLAIPAVLELLGRVDRHHILDIGCGTAALARKIVQAGGRYTGVDSSRRLLAFARRHNGNGASFFHGDATRLDEIPGLSSGAFDAAVFLLSIQDIDPLEPALRCAARALRSGGRVVMLLTHPCFHVPRQSGWGWDAGRRLHYRRIDRYLTPLAVPMKSYGPNRSGSTWSHHRPLEEYVEGLAGQGLLIEAVREIPAPADLGRGGTPSAERRARGGIPKAERRARGEIPLFLGVRAVKR